IAYCDFDPPPGDIVNGRFTWQELSNKETQVVGMFTSGFEDPDIKNYKFILKDSNGKTKYDLTKSISSKIQIIKPGTSPYEECFENDFMNPDDVIGLTFIVKCQDKEIGKALIKSG
ncbi:5867_t:CDS:1, partial [Gigaspora margarita]